MEAIAQLKTMRNDALDRLQNNTDYRLLTSLDNLIVDLEAMHRTNRPKFMIVDDEAEKEVEQESASLTQHEVEKAFGELTSGMEEETDASEDNDKSESPAVSFN